MKDTIEVKGVVYNGVPGSFTLISEVNGEVQFHYPSDDVKILDLVLYIKNQRFSISKAHQNVINGNSNTE